MKTLTTSRSRLKLSTSGIGATPGYEGAGLSRRLSGWRPTRQTINALLSQVGDTLTARGRWLCRNNPYASRAKSSFVSNAIGTGIYPSSGVKDKALKKKQHELFLQWTDESDADGLTDFYGQQAIIAGGMFEAGECFVRIRPRRLSDMQTVPFQLQILESEQLPISRNELLPNGNIIRSSIEFNRLGQRVAYHFLREHPGEAIMDMRGVETVRVPASSVLHLYEPIRPGQIRGQTGMAAAMVKAILLDMYDDAELDRKKVAAMFAGFIRRPVSENADDDILGEGTPDDRGRAIAGLSPGILQFLEDGEDITFAEPGDVGGNYEAFEYRNLLGLCAAFGIPYTNVTGDLRQVSYSSIRAGILEFRRRLEQWQHQTIVFQLCRPTWWRFNDDAVLFGKLEIPGYAENRLAFNRVEWIPDRWDWVDPVKDRQGQRLAKELYAMSSRQIAREEGNDIEDVLDDEEETTKSIVTRGLPVHTSVNSYDRPASQSDADPKTDPIGAEETDAQERDEQAALAGATT